MNPKLLLLLLPLVPPLAAFVYVAYVMNQIEREITSESKTTSDTRAGSYDNNRHLTDDGTGWLS